MNIKTVLFDLDGTLLDTAPDLAIALNIVLQQNARKPLPFDVIRPLSSTGTRGLLGLGFQITEEAAEYPQLREQFLNAYHDHITDQTKIFEGIDRVLHHLEKNGMPWGVVTNKPEDLAKQLLKNFQLDKRSSCIIGGDTLDKRKPDPAPLLHACELIGATPNECVYIGDAERDITAAKNANMFSIAALYGYITAEDNPKTWLADHYIDEPTQIISWMTKNSIG
jgi:2-phosphoglycolate phosphatase